MGEALVNLAAACFSIKAHVEHALHVQEIVATKQAPTQSPETKSCPKCAAKCSKAPKP